VPRNDPTLVDSVARRFGFLPADQIRLLVSEGRRAQLPVGNAVSVGRLLTEFVELQQVATRKQIQIMAEHTRCPMTKPKLMAYVGEDDASAERYRNEVLNKRKSVFDLLEEHPACELPFHLYLEMLSLLAPRYYSISSSPAGEAARCSVTVGVVEAPASSGHGIYRGICSNYLARRRAGDTVHATVKETKAGFRLPDDNAVPVIMIGPGTGSRRSAASCRSARRGKRRARRSAPRFCSSAAAIPSRISSMPTSSRPSRPTASANCTPPSPGLTAPGPMCSTRSRRKRTKSGN